MALYRDWILPRLLDLVMRHPQARRYRRRVIPRAQGRVLEIGAGSGLNLPLYGPQVSHLFALEPSAQLTKMARRKIKRLRLPVEFLANSAEAIPLPDHSVDTVVTTWTLCTIPDPVKALQEVRRVLKPDGLLIFVEHGRAPEPKVVAWQDRLTPFWKRCAGGCHLNRKIDHLVREGGFNITDLQTGYAKGPRPMAFMYEGRARLS